MREQHSSLEVTVKYNTSKCVSDLTFVCESEFCDYPIRL